MVSKSMKGSICLIALLRTRRPTEGDPVSLSHVFRYQVSDVLYVDSSNTAAYVYFIEIVCSRTVRRFAF